MHGAYELVTTKGAKQTAAKHFCWRRTGELTHQAKNQSFRDKQPGFPDLSRSDSQYSAPPRVCHRSATFNICVTECNSVCNTEKFDQFGHSLRHAKPSFRLSSVHTQ